MPKERITEQGSGHLTGRKYTDHVCTSHIRHVSTAQDRAARRCGHHLLRRKPLPALHVSGPCGAGPCLRPRPHTLAHRRPAATRGRCSLTRKTPQGQVSPGTLAVTGYGPRATEGSQTVTRAPRRGGRGRQAADNTGLTQFAGAADTAVHTLRGIFLHLVSDGVRRCVSVRSRCRHSSSPGPLHSGIPGAGPGHQDLPVTTWSSSTRATGHVTPMGCGHKWFSPCMRFGGFVFFWFKKKKKKHHGRLSGI